MIKAVNDYQTKLLHGKTSSRRTPVENTFNAAPYLFASSRLALKFPLSLESKIICAFKTNLPKRTYQHNKNSSMTVYRSRLRLTAVVNSINVMIVFIIGHIMSVSFTALERCFYDLLSWVGIGYLIFWNVVFFRQNAMLAYALYSFFFLALSSIIFYYYKLFGRIGCETKAGVISVQTKMEEEQSETSSGGKFAVRSSDMRHASVKRFGKQRRTGQFYPRFVQAMVAIRDASSADEGSSIMTIKKKKKKRKLDVAKTREMIAERDSRRPTFPHQPHSFSSSHDGQVAINFDLSSSSADEEGTSRQDNTAAGDDISDITMSTPSLSLSRDVLQYIDTIPDNTLRLVRIIRSHKPAMKRILQKRMAANEMKKQLQEEGVEFSDDSDSVLAEGDMFTLSSDSDRDIDSEDSDENVTTGSEEIEKSENSDGTSDGGEVSVREVTSYSSPTQTPRSIAVKERVVNMLNQPKQGNLAQLVRSNRDGIENIGLKRRVTGIEESFVLSTQARRTSTLANQTRARSKLQKRIERRKVLTLNTDADGDGFQHESVPMKEEVGTSSRPSSAEIFEEKKKRLTHYSAHQSLRNHALNTQRQEAKAALLLRISKKKFKNI